jgi:hypothetical protein
MASYQVNPLEILDTTNSTGVGSGGSLTVGGGVSIGKDTHIGGNITVSGTSASFSDNIIVLNSGATTSQDTGLLLERASTDVSAGNNYSALVYSETSDEFRFGYATSDTRGTITLNSYVPIRTGGVYAGDSQIDNISVGNLNFNTLYQNGVPYIGSSQWTTTSGNTLTYTSGSVILSQQLSANNNSNTLGNIFTTGGNVGIGTTNPSNTLDVFGTANITTSVTTGALYSTNVTSTNVVSTNVTSTNVVSTNVTSTNVVGTNVTSTNIIGMNITGANVVVDNIVISRATMSNLELSHMTVSNMISSHQTIGSALVVDRLIATSNYNTIGNIFTTGGNVGIATTSPETTLDISGTVRVTTSLTSGALYSTNVTSTNVVGTNISSSTLNLSTGVTSANAQITNANITTSSIGTLLNTNMVSTNISSGVLALSTGMTSANAQITNLNATSSTIGTFVASSGTVGGHLVPSTNVTYDLGSSSLRWRDIYLSGNTIYLGDKTLSVANDTFNIANIAATTANLTTSTIGTLINTNTVTTNVSSSTLTLSTGLTSASAQITNLNATTGTIASLLTTNAVSTNISSGTLNLSTGLTSASIQVTNLNATTSTIPTLLNTNTITTNVSSGTLNLSTGLTSASAQVTNLNATTSTVATLRNTNTITTNISSGTLNLSTGLTSASIQVTNENATTSTIATLRNTNAVSTNISSGTLNLSTGMTSANAQITNLVSTNISTSTLVASTVSSNVISSTTYTGSNLSLSGNLNVAGTLTTVNITSTNLVNTNVSAGIVVASTSLSATGNSNTIGNNIFTTGGNVGISTTAPVYKLDVNGILRSTGDIIVGNGLGAESIHLWDVPGAAWELNTGNYKLNIRNGTFGTTMVDRVTVTSTGNVGIGTTTPIGKISVDYSGISTNQNVLSLHTSNTGTTDYNLIEAGHGASSTFVLKGNGNVGIGTTSPSRLLQVNQNGYLGSTQGAISVSTNVEARYHLYNNAGIAEWSFGQKSAARSDFTFSKLVSNVESDYLTITTGGNIGIGTTSPVYTLDVNGTIDALSVTSGNVSTGVATIGTLLNTNTVSTNISSSTLVLSTGLTSASAQVTNLNSTTSTIATARVTTSLLAIGNSNTLGNIFTTGGNVGIGTNPVGALDVRDSTNLVGDDGGALYITGGTNGNRRLHMGYHNTNNYGWIEVVEKGVNLQNLSLQPRGGNVGIGTTSPAYLLDVNGTIDALTVTTGNVSTGVATIGTLLNTNAVSTNISSGTLNLSTGLTSANVRLTGTGTSLDIRAAASVNINLQNTSSGNAQTKIHSHSDSRTYFQSSGDIYFAGIDSTNLRGLCLRTSGNIGIGTTAPGYTLDINGTCKVTNELYIANPSAGGTIFLGGGSSGDVGYEHSVIETRNYAATENTELLLFKGNDVVGGSGPDRIRLRAGSIMFDTYSAPTSNRTSENIRMTIYDNGNVGIATTAPAFTLDVNGTFETSNANGVMLFASSGNLGIGNTAPSYKLHVTGDIYATGDITAYSDARLKTNIETISNPLDKVDLLRGVYYTHIETKKESIGLIAQETLEVLPEVVATKGEYLGINYGNIVGLLVEAIKELRQEIKELKNQIN